MSSPYALPEGPTRFAESSTSMPPPEPRSSTVSPRLSWASAVGLPHPSDALSASSGIWCAWSASYRSEVIGSQPPSTAADAPQQELPPVWTRRAAWPYLARTASLIFSALIEFSYLQIVVIRSGFTALFRVQHSA